MKQRILIVDDEHGIVDMMVSYFSRYYDVMTAYNGKEALQRLANKPDLILLDINMPEMDGLTLCQKIREFITCPILFLTARIESATVNVLRRNLSCDGTRKHHRNREHPEE